MQKKKRRKGQREENYTKKVAIDFCLGRGFRQLLGFLHRLQLTS